MIATTAHRGGRRLGRQGPVRGVPGTDMALPSSSVPATSQGRRAAGRLQGQGGPGHASRRRQTEARPPAQIHRCAAFPRSEHGAGLRWALQRASQVEGLQVPWAGSRAAIRACARVGAGRRTAAGPARLTGPVRLIGAGMIAGQGAGGDSCLSGRPVSGLSRRSAAAGSSPVSAGWPMAAGSPARRIGTVTYRSAPGRTQ